MSILLYDEYMMSELSQRQEAILEFVRSKPNSIKTTIIDALTTKGMGSRKTILRDIKTLEDYGMILIHKEKPNSMVHHVRINQESIFLEIKHEVEDLSNNFSQYIDVVNQRIEKLWDQHEETDDADKIDKLTETKFCVEYSLQVLFEHFICIYVLNLVFVWTNKIADSRVLDKIYEIAFDKIKKLGSKVTEVFDTERQVDRWSEIGGETIERLFVLKPNQLASTASDIKKAGLYEQAQPVLNSLWKAGLPFINDALLHAYGWDEGNRKELFGLRDEWKLNDWKEVIKRKRRWTADDKFPWVSIYKRETTEKRSLD
jgi:hypothetical protein